MGLAQASIPSPTACPTQTHCQPPFDPSRSRSRCLLASYSPSPCIRSGTSLRHELDQGAVGWRSITCTPHPRSSYHSCYRSAYLGWRSEPFRLGQCPQTIPGVVLVISHSELVAVVRLEGTHESAKKPQHWVRWRPLSESCGSRGLQRYPNSVV